MKLFRIVREKFNRIHFIRRYLFFGALIAFAAVVLVSGIIYADYTCGGTLHTPPNTKTWTGYSYIHWYMNGSTINYSGESYTQASQTVTTLTVTSVGAETCGIFTMGPDWYSGPASVNDTWLIGRYGNGSVIAGTCLYYWYPHWVVGTHGYHAIWDQGTTPNDGSGQSESWHTENWW
jgi:hypothetical protein